MRAREFITEASYDQMIMTMKAEYPDQQSIINSNLKWAKSNLKKEDRIVWFMKVVRDVLAGKKESLGDYAFVSFEKLQDDILHFYGYPVDSIQKYDLKGKTVRQVLNDFTDYEIEYNKNSKDTTVIPHAGDVKLFQFSDGTSWWKLDRAFCEEEGKSGKHCGNVVGKHKPDQRILSLRKPVMFMKKHPDESNVILTFILEPNGYLGEMKAKGNQKPADKWHPHIMKLLLSDTVKGIKGAGYLPEMNFSIFDLGKNNLSIINKEKPSFIIDQLDSEPTEIFKAPSWIIKEYYGDIKQKTPAIGSIIQENGSLSNTPSDWERAININKFMIFGAPDTIENYEEKLVETITLQQYNILKAPLEMRNNFDLMTKVIEYRPSCIIGLTPKNTKYIELCKIALNIDGTVLEYIPEELRNYELCKIALKNEGSFSDVPESIREKHSDLALMAFVNNPSAIEYIPEDDITIDMAQTALEHSRFLVDFIPKKIWEDADFIEWAVNLDGFYIKHVPESALSNELCEVAVRNEPTSIRYIPDSYKTSRVYATVFVFDKSFNLDDVPVVDRDREFFYHSLSLLITNADGYKLEQWAENISPSIINSFIETEFIKRVSFMLSTSRFNNYNVAATSFPYSIEGLGVALSTYKMEHVNEYIVLSQVNTPDAIRNFLSTYPKYIRYFERAPDLTKLEILKEFPNFANSLRLSEAETPLAYAYYMNNIAKEDDEYWNEILGLSPKDEHK